jgi:hypothetical protein
VAWSESAGSCSPHFAALVGRPQGLPAQPVRLVQGTAQMAQHPVDRAFAGNQDSAETALCPAVFGLEWPPVANLAREETAPEAATETEERRVGLEPLAGLEPEALMDLWVLPAGSDPPAVVPAGRGMAVGPVVVAVGPVVVADWDQDRALAEVGRRALRLSRGFRQGRRPALQ